MSKPAPPRAPNRGWKANKSRDAPLNSQRAHSPLVTSLRTQIRWLSFDAEPNLWHRWHPLRPFVHWYHGRIVNRHIGRALDRRLAMHREAAAEGGRVDPKRTRTIIDLALSTYDDGPAADDGADGGAKDFGASKPDSGAVDPFFKTICRSQIKLFLFSGHDTTSSALCYHLYLLSRHPSSLARLQAEHAAILGPDPTAAGQTITANPALLNQLPFTAAVIRESLRLFPTVTVSREGLRDYAVPADDGREYPTEGFLVFPNPHTPQRDPAYWPRADDFVPERWLAREGEAMYPTKGAWRAFETGPRNCIGQELAMLEMKIVLCLAVRRWAVRARLEVLGEGDVRGERAYQTQLMGPRGDLPCVVERVERVGRGGEDGGE